MSKFFNIKTLTILAILVVGSVLLLRPNQALALCPQVGVPCVLTGTLGTMAEAVGAAITTHTNTVKQAIENHVRLINRQLNRTTRSIVRATNGVGRNYTNGIGNLGASYGKTKEAGIKQRLIHRQNMHNLRVQNDLAVTAADCRRASNLQHQASATALTQSVKKVRDYKSRRRHLNSVGTDGAGGSIAATASRYRNYVENFCDPDDPAPNMEEECVHNSALKGSLFSVAGIIGGRTMKGAQSEEYVDMMMEMLNPNRSDRISLPAFSTATGQARWWRQYAAAIKRVIVDSNINALSSETVPVANAKDQYVAIANASLGLAGAAGGNAAALAEHNSMNIGTESGQISLAEMRKIEAENALNLFSLVDTQKMGTAALDRMSIAELQKNVRQKYEMFKSLRRQNLALSVVVAGKI